MSKCYIAGVWDLFHVGHLRAIKRAWELAGLRQLIVGVVTDEHALEYKGAKPVIPYRQRFEIIDSLWYPSRVVPQTKQFSVEHMKSLDVNTVFLGKDWKDKMPLHLKRMMSDIEVIFIPRTSSISTTEIIEKIKR